MRATVLFFVTVAMCVGCNKDSDGKAPEPSASELAPASSGGEHRRMEKGDWDGGAREHRERGEEKK
jgi:hypothetical protein